MISSFALREPFLLTKTGRFRNSLPQWTTGQLKVVAPVVARSVRMKRKKKKQRPVQKGSAAGRQLQKLRPTLLFMLEKYQPKCHFCHGRLTEEDLYLFTVHHVNQNRADDSIENKEPAHRRCHKAFHRRYTASITELLKEED
jgi:hypothetical protein